MIGGSREPSVTDSLLASALEQDPGFAKAWELRAMLQTLIEAYGYATESREELERRATDFAQRALSVDPNSATALVVQAQIRLKQTESLRQKHDIAAILADYDRALEIEPNNVTALNWRGLARAAVGDLPAARRDFERCKELEPYNWACTVNVFVTFANMGQDDEALLAYRDALDLGLLSAGDGPLPTFARKGEELLFKTSTNARNILFGWGGHDDLYRAYQNPDADHTTLIDSILQFGKVTPRVDTVAINYILGPLGAYDAADIDLDRWDPIYSGYRQTDVFKNRNRQSGILEYWQTYGFPPQCKPLGSNDFECP
jgi:hypothetical protein